MVTAYDITRGETWQQEWYDAATRGAAARARQLRKLGYRVTVHPAERQLTTDGVRKLQLVTIWHEGRDVPMP
jgi:hypothetical protein